MKKIIWTLGTSLLVLTPVVTTISCGKKSTTSHTIASKAESESALSEGLSIDQDKISIDFSKANIESSQFASDVLNFFNSHKGQRVSIKLTNSPFNRLNNRQVDYRVSINGFSSLEQLMDSGINKLDESYVDLTSEELASYGEMSGFTSFRDLLSEKAQSDAEAARQQAAIQVEAAHNQAWNNYLAKWNEASAISLAVPSDKRANGNPPVKPAQLPQTSTVDALNNGINALNTFITQAHAFIATFHTYELRRELVHSNSKTWISHDVDHTHHTTDINEHTSTVENWKIYMSDGTTTTIDVNKGETVRLTSKLNYEYNPGYDIEIQPLDAPWIAGR